MHKNVILVVGSVFGKHFSADRSDDKLTFGSPSLKSGTKQFWLTQALDSNPNCTTGHHNEQCLIRNNTWCEHSLFLSCFHSAKKKLPSLSTSYFLWWAKVHTVLLILTRNLNKGTTEAGLWTWFITERGNRRRSVAATIWQAMLMFIREKEGNIIS